MNQSRTATPHFRRPPQESGPEGKPRRVGIELEMTGLEPEQMAQTVVASVGGEIERESPFVTRVTETELGDFHIELDADLLKSRSYQKHLAEFGIDIGEGEMRDNLESVLSRVAGIIVPLELVGPPVPWTELERLDRIRLELHRSGARGTGSSAIYAFGMHLNIEAASLEADYLLAILRAFVLRYEWLLEREQVDLSRRISPYVQPYREDYVTHLLQQDYQPGISRLIDDFLSFTPTRNRPLDLLPLFAHIDFDRVMAAPVERELIKPRPAFHYRLPNCLIDQPEWSLAVAWNDWIRIEQLAADPERLDRERRNRLSDSTSVKRWFMDLLSRFWS